LQRFVVNPIIPPRYLTEDDRVVDRINPNYETWEVQDQTLLVWMQSTLSKSVLSRVLGSDHSYQVWDKIHEHFSLHTKTRARQFRTAMRAVTLDGKTIEEYLHKIKGFVDELAGVGVPVCHEEYVDALLEGLSSDYALVVSVIESKKRTPSITEIEAWLYEHETRLMHYNKEVQVVNSASINYTQGCLYPNAYKTGNSGGSHGAYDCGGGRGAFSDCGAGHGGGGSGRGRGGGRFTNFQSQICLKFGHTANVCHFWSDLTFHPYESLTFIDPTTLQPIPYSTSLVRTSNTWVNPNSKNPGPSHSQPSAMLTSSNSQRNGQAGTTWIPDSGASFHVTGDSKY